jgi:hypothetical protein
MPAFKNESMLTAAYEFAEENQWERNYGKFMAKREV